MSSIKYSSCYKYEMGHRTTRVHDVSDKKINPRGRRYRESVVEPHQRPQSIRPLSRARRVSPDRIRKTCRGHAPIWLAVIAAVHFLDKHIIFCEVYIDGMCRSSVHMHSVQMWNQKHFKFPCVIYNVYTIPYHHIKSSIIQPIHVAHTSKNNALVNSHQLTSHM